MNVNGTLVLQIIHFFIAYFLIDRLLVRRVVALIKQEKSEQNVLMQTMHEAGIAVQAQEESKELGWQQARRQFAHDVPPLYKPAPEAMRAAAITAVTITPEAKQLYTKTLKDFFVKKVLHGTF